jgi:sugar transferase (PEP-CTERM/EpsH1 system associated)
MSRPAADRVRVVHVVSTLGIGGQEMVILSLIRHMDRARFVPHVICLHDRGPLAEQIEALGVTVEVVGEHGVGLLEMGRRLARRLRTLRPDVVHTHNPAPHQAAAIARLLTRFPALVHTKHGRNNFPTRARRWAEQFAGKMTDIVVPVSTDAAEVARRVDRVPPRKLRVILNGIEVRGVPQATPLPEGRPPRAVHVARLNRVKDQGSLLRAAREVADRLPGFTLDMVGDGPMHDDIHALAAELGLGDVVRFHGFRDDVGAVLAESDLFVLSSLSEGISITLLEAMAAGLPVIATDVGGNREVVVHGETGALVPAGVPVALAEAMLRVLTDPAAARRMGAAGRARVAAAFAIDRTVDDYAAIYEELLAGMPVAVAA